MTGRLTIHSAGPMVTVQDMGRSGTLSLGLSRGGAVDRLALIEAAALLGLSAPVAAIEMAGMGGVFSTDTPTRIALTGAPMRATLDGAPLDWHGSHLLPAGARLEIGPVTRGAYGYVCFVGGIETHPVLGSRATHVNAGLGHRLTAGDSLPLGPDPAPDAPAMALPVEDRFSGGEIRIVEGPQTRLYSSAIRARFTETGFRRSTHGNRQGVRLDFEGEPFTAEGQLGIVSDVIISGDIQMTGDGIPFVLGPECQTIGGYPRIGAVIPADLPRVLQAAPHAPLQFRFVTLDEADAAFTPEAALLKRLRAAAQPRVRDPRDIADLLGYQLISGVTAGDELKGD
ncbi:biotin-dependent carboxyltransferase family protein [Aquicoccus porphyridii]|uniref:5-oxoprolinase subunit C family protein n=1 Tax=Aquicoccus porphyridii TaxID=1852029 RepID=UPI00273E1E76|nr:urea amidolyase [Aquicoccus porphyridii]